MCLTRQTNILPAFYFALGMCVVGKMWHLTDKLRNMGCSIWVFPYVHVVVTEESFTDLSFIRLTHTGFLP